jgi:hypothetical protein
MVPVVTKPVAGMASARELYEMFAPVRQEAQTMDKAEEEHLTGGFYAAPFSDPRWQAIVDTASDISLEYGVHIAPHVISERRFHEWSPLDTRVKEEGIEIWRNEL